MSLGAAILFLSLTCCAQGDRAQDDPQPASWEKGIAIIRDQGAQAGIDYFRDQTIRSEDIRDLYGLAYSLWLDGQVESAKEICYFILKQTHATDRLKANCQYLLGHANKYIGKYDEARFRFNEAMVAYRQLNLYAELFETYCGLVSVSLLSKDLSNVDYYFEKAIEINAAAKKNMGYFYSLAAAHAFVKKDIQSALDFSHLSHQEFEKTADIFDNYNQLASIAFYSILLGHFEEGFEKAKEVEKICRDKQLTKLAFYNLINLYLLEKCMGTEYGTTRSEIEGWIEEQQDKQLRELLIFADTWNCQPFDSRAKSDSGSKSSRTQSKSKSTKMVDNPPANPPGGTGNPPPSSGSGN